MYKLSLLYGLSTILSSLFRKKLHKIFTNYPSAQSFCVIKKTKQIRSFLNQLSLLHPLTYCQTKCFVAPARWPTPMLTVATTSHCFHFSECRWWLALLRCHCYYRHWLWPVCRRSMQHWCRCWLVAVAVAAAVDCSHCHCCIPPALGDWPSGSGRPAWRWSFRRSTGSCAVLGDRCQTDCCRSVGGRSKVSSARNADEQRVNFDWAVAESLDVCAGLRKDNLMVYWMRLN